MGVLDEAGSTTILETFERDFSQRDQTAFSMSLSRIWKISLSTSIAETSITNSHIDGITRLF